MKNYTNIGKVNKIKNKHCQGTSHNSKIRCKEKLLKIRHYRKTENIRIADKAIKVTVKKKNILASF